MTSADRPTSLVVPELLQGQWSSAVVLTFGADLGFFEARLLNQLAAVPLRVILADEEQLRRKLAEAADTGQRWARANRTYIAGPIRHGRAAHAKMILLVAEREGLLVIGSGNLGHDGYASPGELWTVYRYHDDTPEHLSKFGAAKSFLSDLVANDLIDVPVQEVLNDVWSVAPWLAPETDDSICHNLATPLIAHLAERVTWPVEELAVHAPFHDPECAALAELIARFEPDHVRVLVSKDTSLDPAKLKKVLKRANTFGVDLIQVQGDAATYIHAKWVHLIGKDKELVLTGSANLSRSALLHDSSTGNIELGVMSHGPRGSFSGIYEHLHVEPNPDLTALGMAVQASEPRTPPPQVASVLWSRLDGTRLTVRFDRDVEAGVVLTVHAASGQLSWTSQEIDGAWVVLSLDSQSAVWVAEGGPLEFVVDDGSDDFSHSWPYQVSAVRSRLEKAGHREQLPRIGDLPENDADLFAVLQELEESLIFDRTTLWRVAKPGQPIPDGEDHDETTVAWSDLDWDRVRRDPRYTGYFFGGRSAGTTPTEIQVILAAIAGRLGDIGVASRDGMPNEDESELARPGADDNSDVAEEAEDEAVDELVRRTLPVGTRTKMAFNRFIKRYTSAVRDDAFVDELGPVLTASNAVIFGHLIAKLAERGLLNHETAAEAEVAIWTLLWGDGVEKSGLLSSLAGSELDAANKVVAEAKARQTALRAMAGAFELDVTQETWTKLRDEVRHLVVDATFDLDEELVRLAEPAVDQAEALLGVIVEVVSEATRSERDDYILEPLGGVARRSREWQQVQVRRQSSAGGATTQARELVVHTAFDGLSHEAACLVLERMVAAAYLAGESDTYFRVRFKGNDIGDVAFWDDDHGYGLTYLSGEEREITDLEPSYPDWLLALDDLQAQFAGDASISGAA